jgi:hypothetical protein
VRKLQGRYTSSGEMLRRISDVRSHQVLLEVVQVLAQPRAGICAADWLRDAAWLKEDVSQHESVSLLLSRRLLAPGQRIGPD